MYNGGSNPVGHCFLVPRLISGLSVRAREHLRMAGDLDRFPVGGGLEQFLEYLKTKNGKSSTTGRVSGIQEVHLRNQTCEGCVHDELDQPIFDGHEKQNDVSTRCTFFRTHTGPSTNSRMATSSQSEIARSRHCWSHDHDRRQSEYQTCRQVSSPMMSFSQLIDLMEKTLDIFENNTRLRQLKRFQKTMMKPTLTMTTVVMMIRTSMKTETCLRPKMLCLTLTMTRSTTKHPFWLSPSVQTSTREFGKKYR